MWPVGAGPAQRPARRQRGGVRRSAPDELHPTSGTREAAMLTFAIHLHLHLFHHVKGPAFDYIGVAVASFASWAGLPGPGESLLLAAGVFAAKHKLDITPLLVVAWLGATAGGIVGWLFGRIAGRSVLTAPGPLRTLRLDAV